MTQPLRATPLSGCWPGFPAVWVDASWGVFHAKWRRWERTRPGR